MVEDKPIIIEDERSEEKYYHIDHSFWGLNIFDNFLFEKGKYISNSTLKYVGFTNRTIKKYSSILKEYKFGKYKLLPHPIIDKVDLMQWKERRKDLIDLSTKIEEKKKKEEEEEEKLQYQRKTGIFLIDNYFENVDFFCEEFPFFYDQGCIFWFWNREKYKWEMKDETDIMNLIDDKLSLFGQTIKSTYKNNYLEAFKRVGRKNTPEEPSKDWIQFKNKIIDLKTNKIFEATPKYFFCNPIPYELGENSKTPTIDKLFEEWVGKEYVQTLYDIIAYCCIADYPIHLIFCFVGSGRNGKSRFLKLLSNFIGSDNISSTELDLIMESRFETIKLYKKLVCLLGETNFGMMNKTSMLKKITGQDLIGFEKKNKTPFDDYNYAKVLISSNSLPTSEDTSEGFYRRWLIIDFPNTFPEGKDILNIIPLEEYNSLAKKVSEIAPKLLERGTITGMGSIEKRKENYIMASNPFPLFIKTECKLNVNGFVLYSELYIKYVKFLNKLKKRVVSHKEFVSALLREGLERQKTSKQIKDGVWHNGNFVLGIEFVTDVTDVTEFSLSFPLGETKSEVEHKYHKCHIGAVLPDLKNKIGKIFHKCKICGKTPCTKYHKGSPICESCSKFFKDGFEEIN